MPRLGLVWWRRTLPLPPLPLPPLPLLPLLLEEQLERAWQQTVQRWSKARL